MWICPKCGEKLEDQYDRCWSCHTPAPVSPQAPPAPPVKAGSCASNGRVAFEVFRATFKTWDDLFAEAAEFAGKVGADRLISISHSDSNGEGVVTVWYWTEPGD